MANGVRDRSMEEHAADLETCEVYAHGLTGCKHAETPKSKLMLLWRPHKCKRLLLQLH